MKLGLNYKKPKEQREYQLYNRPGKKKKRRFKHFQVKDRYFAFKTFVYLKSTLKKVFWKK